MYARRLLLMVLVSGAAHAALVALAPGHEPPAPRPYRKQAAPATVSVYRAAKPAPVQAPKPAPEPRPEPPKPRPEPPKPRPEPPKEAPAPPKPDAPPPAPAPPPPAASKPAPFVLSNVALNGGVQVQAGTASNLFGDPSRDAAGFRKGSDAPRVEGTDGGTGGIGAAPRKVVVKPPQALNDVRGAYPEQHRDLGRVVRIELLLSISPAGEVVDAQVRKGDLPAFDDEARRTARRLRFRPATRDGVPIPYQIQWTVVFLPEG